jgi:hypothetical protein
VLAAATADAILEGTAQRAKGSAESRKTSSKRRKPAIQAAQSRQTLTGQRDQHGLAVACSTQNQTRRSTSELETSGIVPVRTGDGVERRCDHAADGVRHPVETDGVGHIAV